MEEKVAPQCAAWVTAGVPLIIQRGAEFYLGAAEAWIAQFGPRSNAASMSHAGTREGGVWVGGRWAWAVGVDSGRGPVGGGDLAVPENDRDAAQMAQMRRPRWPAIGRGGRVPAKLSTLKRDSSASQPMAAQSRVLCWARSRIPVLSAANRLPLPSPVLQTPNLLAALPARLA